MRLWSLHPRYLDPPGLVALWRESLLAREVIRGNTRGYRAHPQLDRFLGSGAPLGAINAYLREVYREATRRGYAFDGSKVARGKASDTILVTEGQLAYEWEWLMGKLARRSPEVHRLHGGVQRPDPHPIFVLCPGPVADWERPAVA